MADKKPSCCVCSVDGSKYRCPHCREPYCSVKCNKAHKELCKGVASELSKDTGNELKFDDKLDDKGTATSSSPREGDIGSRIIDTTQTSKLEKSSYVRSMISGSKRLRDSISAIDDAGDARQRSAALRKLRRNNKDFDEFVIKMINEVE